MSPRRCAFIDIGTNAILCLIVEIRDTGRFRVLDDLAEIPRLGEGVDKTRRIGAAGERRSIEVLESYLSQCRNLGVEEIIAVGTSALPKRPPTSFSSASQEAPQKPSAS